MPKIITTIDFVSKAVEKHNNLYDYSFVEYTTAHSKIAIICQEHGLFYQTANSHLNGRGCPNCAKIAAFTNHTQSLFEFIERAKTIHGDKYDYSKSIYTKAIEKIEIICPIHGSFQQTPNNHLNNKQGCPKCFSSKGEETIRQFLIQHNIVFAEQYRNPNCKDIRPLPFDFYLPDYNLLIEYHGRQHFEFIPKFHKTTKVFQDSQRRDQIKREWAIQNMNYLEISYKDDIESILVANLI
jgi:hypothetical protein